MYLVKYAPLYFHYSIYSQECFCLGILFYNVTTKERDFLHIRNYKRFHIFCDEIDMKNQLMGIKDDIINYEKHHHEPFDINTYARETIHWFTYSKIRDFEVDENFDYKTYLSKLYLKYDYPKGERL